MVIILVREAISLFMYSLFPIKKLPLFASKMVQHLAEISLGIGRWWIFLRIFYFLFAF
jgi:hypothetical protein